MEDEGNIFTNFNKETDIPSTIDFQSESFNQYSPFPYQQKKQTEDTPKTDTNSAHNHEKTIDFSLVNRIYLHFPKILLEES